MIYEDLDGSDKIKSFLESLKLPHQISINLTYACNYSCEFCAIPLTKKKKGDEIWLSRKSIIELAKEFKEMGGKEIYLTGGEPLLKENITKILKDLGKTSLRVEMVTNGSLIDQKNAKVLVDELDSIMISLQGSTAETHNKLTKSNSYGDVVKNIQLLDKVKEERSSDIEISLNTVITSKNILEIPNMAKLGNALDVDKVNLQPFHVFIDELEYLKVNNYDLFERKLKEFKDNLNKEIRNSPDFYDFLLDYFKKKERKFNRCVNPSVSTFITPDGKVYPCCFLSERDEYVMGNLNDLTFEEIWKTEQFEEFRKGSLDELQSDVCKTCATLLDRSCSEFAKRELKNHGINI